MCTKNKQFVGANDKNEGNRNEGKTKMREKKKKKQTKNGNISQKFSLQRGPFKFKIHKDI